MSQAGAFTVDFTGVAAGTTVPPNLTLDVPGYGTITISSIVMSDGTGPSNLVIGDTFDDGGVSTRSLEFDEKEQVLVTFNGSEATGVDFDYVGVSGGEEFNTSAFLPNTYIVNLQGSGDGAGLSGISWNAVPEPSTSLMGLIGGLALLGRRKRA